MSKVITKFNLDTSDIKAVGETREFTVLGDNGAVFYLEIKNEDNYYYNFKTNLFQAGKTKLGNISITGGSYSGNITFPTVTDADQYDFSLFALDTENTKHSDYVEFRFEDGSLDINSSTGSNSNLIQKVIYQTLDVTLTLASYSPNETVTGTVGTQTIATSRKKSNAKVPFSFIFTVTSTRTLTIIKQPTANDIMAFITATVGATPVDIEGENIYPTATPAFTGDDVNGAVTSGAVVRMDNTDLSAVIKVGDKITTPTTEDTVDGNVESGIKVVMDTAVAAKMAVGDRVTGNAALDASVITVAALNPDGDNAKEFSLSEAVVIVDGITLFFSSKINRSTTTVTVVETSSTATDFTMSQDIQFRDNAPLTFFNRRNHRWPLSSSTEDLSKIRPQMRQLQDTAFASAPTVKDYVDQVTLFEGEPNEQIIERVRVPAVDTKGIAPTISRNATTKVVTRTVGSSSNPINVTFSDQALLAFGGGTNARIFSYGTSEINRLTGFDVEFSDLAVALTKVTTTTTSAVSASTSVPITTRAGIMDGISTVSGIGINPAVANPTVSSGAGSVTGAGTIVLSAAQTLENGITLTFPGASTIATITGNIKVNSAGNKNTTLRFDLEKFLTMH